jgi:hypothetical protein
MATATQDTKAQDTNKADTTKPVNYAEFSKEKLIEEITNGSTVPAVYEALRKLHEGEEKKKSEKKGVVTKLVAEMEKLGITMLDLKEAGAPVPDIDKLFDGNTIKLAAGTGTTRTTKPKASGGETKTREGNIQHNGQKYNWTRNLDDAAKLPLFEAFKAGKSVKAFLVKPDDKAASARLIARLEREASADGKKVSYSEANLTELGLTRESIKAAIEAKDKADKAKAAK